jgi:hypothetical protein
MEVSPLGSACAGEAPPRDALRFGWLGPRLVALFAVTLPRLKDVGFSARPSYLRRVRANYPACAGIR